MGVLHKVMGFIWNGIYVGLVFFVNLVMVYPIMNIIHSFMPNFLYQNPTVHTFLWYVFTAVGYLGLPMTMVNADFFMAISSMVLAGILLGFVFPIVPGLKQLLSFFRGERPLTCDEEEKIEKVLAYMEKKAGKPLGKWTIWSCNVGLGYNAFAEGHRHIVITPESIAHFSIPELAGLIAHEMGHYVHGDTRGIGLANGFTVVGNICIRILGLFIQITRILTIIPLLGYLFLIMNWIFALYERLYVLLRHIPTFIGNMVRRRQEYLADAYGLELNLGPEVVLMLERLYETYGDLSWWDTLKIDHPRTKDRIQTMRELVDFYTPNAVSVPTSEASDVPVTVPGMAAVSVPTDTQRNLDNPAVKGNRW